MNKLIMPALGAALALGGTQLASAQMPIPGQPGYTGALNRTTPPGTFTGQNYTPPGTFLPAPSGVTSQPNPRSTGPEYGLVDEDAAGPAERDAQGRLQPTRRARFVGERGPDGKLLPSYSPSQAQATQPPPQSDERMRSGQTPPATQQNRMPAPPISAPRDQRSQTDTGTGSSMGQSGTATPPASGTMGQTGGTGSSQMGQPSQSGGAMQRSRSGQSDMGQSQSGQRGQMSRDRQQSGAASEQQNNPPNATALLNRLSAEGYTVTSDFRRVGNQWEASAKKGDRAVTVQVDPSTQQISER